MPSLINSGNKQGDSPKQLSGPQLTTGGGTRVHENRKQVDIDYVVDTTGSMNDKIEALLQTLADFSDEPAKFNLDTTFTLVSFGDLVACAGSDKIVTEIQITDKVDEIRRALHQITHNAGGGNNGESSLEAVITAMSVAHREKALKVMILLTDEPALQHQYTAAQITERLKAQNYLVFTVTPNIDYFKSMATVNGGSWTQISASSDLQGVKDLFRRLAQQVANVSNDVIKLGKGDVQTYLRLKSGK